MIDLEAIRARVRFWDDCSEVVMTQAEIDAKQLLAHVDELREAAGKVVIIPTTTDKSGASDEVD